MLYPETYDPFSRLCLQVAIGATVAICAFAFAVVSWPVTWGWP